MCDPTSPGGNTLKACSTNASGGTTGKTVVCGGATPVCAAEVVDGKSYAACCPQPSGAILDPRAPGCKP